MDPDIITTTPAETVSEVSQKRFQFNEKWLSPLTLLPSMAAIIIFVYLFIGFSFWVSISNWRTLKQDLTLRDPLLATYGELFSTPRFQADLRNTLVFTILFITMAIIVGLGIAIVLERKIAGKVFFRNVVLFPYALSFIVTGVAWRWIFNPETGVNLFFEIFGINGIMSQMGMEPLQPRWTTNPDVWFQVNDVIANVWPAAGELSLKLGVPAAMIPVVLAATWQLSGFVMAMYLGGLGTVSQEVREAARIDGANEWQVYRRVVIPMLKPITISVFVILLHVSMKIFDLIFAMSGVGPGFATDVPAIFVFETMFKATRYNMGSAAAIVMLVVVALIIVPYLVSTLRED